jgi:hypothetical protein
MAALSTRAPSVNCTLSMNPLTRGRTSTELTLYLAGQFLPVCDGNDRCDGDRGVAVQHLHWVGLRVAASGKHGCQNYR